MQQLADLEEQVHQAPNPDLLSRLPVAPVDLDLLPDELSRRLFEALRLQIHYDGVANEAVCRITLTGDTIDAVALTTQEAAVIPERHGNPDHGKYDKRVESGMKPDRDHATMCMVPPTGTPADGCGSGQGRSVGRLVIEGRFRPETRRGAG